MGLNCLFAREANSRAMRRPRTETAKAASLRAGVIVITGVLSGRMLEVMSRPAAMLPQASRLIGVIAFGSFSLIGVREELNRGCPMLTK